MKVSNIINFNVIFRVPIKEKMFQVRISVNCFVKNNWKSKKLSPLLLTILTFKTVYNKYGLIFFIFSFFKISQGRKSAKAFGRTWLY